MKALMILAITFSSVSMAVCTEDGCDKVPGPVQPM